MLKRTITFGLILLLTLALAGPALAAEEFEATGTVVSVGTDSFELQTEDGVVTVIPPGDFDLSALLVGDLVEVEGEIEDGVVTAFKVVNETEHEDEEDEEEDGEEGDDEGSFYCENPEETHPVIGGMAERYESSYAEILGYFCGDEQSGYGLGEIMLAFQTASAMGEGSAADLLAQKTELGGWGKVWQALGLIGSQREPGPPPWAGGPPPWAGGGNGGNGGGPPPWAGGPNNNDSDD